MKLPVVPNLLLELLSVSLFAASAAALSAKEIPQYSSRVWEVEDGLPHNSVLALAQTRDGYLWIGTQNGLTRFDGIRFTVFNSLNTPAIKNSSINALCEGADGSLWIGTLNAGLIRFHQGNFSFYQSQDGFVDDSIRALCSSRDGSVWIGTTNGVSRFHDDKFQNFSTKDGLANEIVRGLCEDRDGTVWIATGNYLHQWKQGKLSALGEGQEEFRAAWRVVFPDAQGNLWAGADSGLMCFHRDGSRTHYDRFSEGLPDSFVISVGEGKDGVLWVGTFGGLGRKIGNRFITESNSAGETYGQINALLADREGNFWVGTKDGLYRLTRKPFRSYTQQHGLPQNNVSSVRESANGSMWFGTWGGGFAEWKKDTNVITGHEAIHVSHNQYGVSFDQALAIGEGRDGSLWFGTDFDGGLFQWKNRELRRFGQRDGLIDPAIRVIHEDQQGNLWLGTRTALVLFRDEKFTRFTTNEGLTGATVRSICEDHEGNLWVGTSDGLSRIQNEKLKKMQSDGSQLSFTSFTIRDGLPNNTIMALHEDGERTLWIGTSAGLCRRKENERFTFYTSEHGIFCDEIFEILEDGNGFLWMSSPKGIFRIRIKDFDDFDLGKLESLPCTAYGKADGLATIQCNGVAKPAGWKARDGRLWFATTKGAAVVDPRGDVSGNEVPPPVVIEQFVADKQVQSVMFNVQSQGPHAMGTTLNFEPETLNLKPGRGDLEFHYTALSFTAPEKNRFKYKLEGIDSDWIDAGTRRTAFYNNIRPGTYTFHVMGCNNDGIWNSLGANVKFTLQPHFWQTKWFLGLIALTLIGVVSGAARYVIWKNVQQKLRRLEQRHAIERERTRIAQDMHDDLGSRLTEILLITNQIQQSKGKPEQVGPQAERVSSVAREVADNLDALVWTVDPGNDSLPRLLVYIREYAGNFVEPTNIRLRFDTPMTLPEIPLSSEVRHNLLLVFKEALNNAIKYSECSEIRIWIKVEPNKIHLGIEDNGKGFMPETVAGNGNGLINMEKRLSSIGGGFSLRSVMGEGTRIELEIPLR